MNNKGLGLIEVMISIAIISVVMAGLAQTIELSAIQATTADVRAQSTALITTVSNTALNEVECTKAITKTTQAYGNSIRFDLADDTIISDNSNIPAYGVYVKRLTYNGILVGTGRDGSKAYYGNLQLALGTNKQVIGPNVWSPKAIGSVYLTVSPEGIIVKCGVTAPTLPAAVVPPITPPLTESELNKQCVEIGMEYKDGKCVRREGCDRGVE